MGMKRLQAAASERSIVGPFGALLPIAEGAIKILAGCSLLAIKLTSSD